MCATSCSLSASAERRGEALQTFRALARATLGLEREGTRERLARTEWRIVP